MNRSSSPQRKLQNTSRNNNRCSSCNIQTHERSILGFRKPITNRHVKNGVCLRCHTDVVPLTTSINSSPLIVHSAVLKGTALGAAEDADGMSISTAQTADLSVSTAGTYQSNLDHSHTLERLERNNATWLSPTNRQETPHKISNGNRTSSNSNEGSSANQKRPKPVSVDLLDKRERAKTLRKTQALGVSSPKHSTGAPVSVDVFVRQDEGNGSSTPEEDMEKDTLHSSMLSQAELEAVYEESRRQNCPSQEELARRYQQQGQMNTDRTGHAPDGSNNLPPPPGDDHQETRRENPTRRTITSASDRIQRTRQPDPEGESFALRGRQERKPQQQSLTITASQLQMIQDADPVLRHMAQQVDPERELVQVTPIPQQYVQGRDAEAAKEYHSGLINALYASVTAMQLQSQGLALPPPNAIKNGALRALGAIPLPMIGSVLYCMSELIACIQEQRNSVNATNNARQFLDALPAAGGGPDLDRFLSKLAAAMVVVQMERYNQEGGLNQVLTVLENDILASGCKKATSSKYSKVLRNLNEFIQRGQQWSRQMAQRIKLVEDDNPLELSPCAATGILHAGMIVKGVLEKAQAEHSLKSALSPEEAATELLDRMGIESPKPQKNDKIQTLASKQDRAEVDTERNDAQQDTRARSPTINPGGDLESDCNEILSAGVVDGTDYSASLFDKIRKLEKQVALLKAEKNKTNQRLNNAENRFNLMQSHTRTQTLRQTHTLTAGVGVEASQQQQGAVNDQAAGDIAHLLTTVDEQGNQMTKLTFELSSLAEQLRTLQEKQSSSHETSARRTGNRAWRRDANNKRTNMRGKRGKDDADAGSLAEI